MEEDKWGMPIYTLNEASEEINRLEHQYRIDELRSRCEEAVEHGYGVSVPGSEVFHTRLDCYHIPGWDDPYRCQVDVAPQFGLRQCFVCRARDEKEERTNNPPVASSRRDDGQPDATE